MVERRAGVGEGFGVLRIGAGVFAVAAMVAAATSPLAGELSRSIQPNLPPTAQSAPSGDVPASATAVRVLRLPPLPLVAGVSTFDVVDDNPNRRRGGRAAGRARSAPSARAAPEPLAPAAAPVAAPVATGPAAPAGQDEVALSGPSSSPGRAAATPAARRPAEKGPGAARTRDAGSTTHTASGTSTAPGQSDGKGRSADTGAERGRDTPRPR